MKRDEKRNDVDNTSELENQINNKCANEILGKWHDINDNFHGIIGS